MMKTHSMRLNHKQALTPHTHRLLWGAVNVRTLHTNIAHVNGTLQIEGASPNKPFELCDLLAQHNISPAALSEVRWKESGSIQLGDYLCLFSGLPQAAPVALQGVGFVLNPQMIFCLEKSWLTSYLCWCSSSQNSS